MDMPSEKCQACAHLAHAIGEALDITLKAANLVTVPMLDARFAQHEAKMEARFGAVEIRFSALERALERTKVWAVLLYAGLVTAFFGALAVEHRWLVNREDQFAEQLQARNDANIAAENARADQRAAQENARIERQIAEDRARTDKQIAEDHARTDKQIAEDHAH